MAEPGPSSNRDMDLSVEAMNHLIQGKRHLLVQDYPSAVGSLQEACELFVKKYGETGSECGEVYFHYGRALLELAREERGILSGPLEDREEEEDDDDDDDDDEDDDSDEQPDTAESVSGNEQTENQEVQGDNNKENGAKLNDSGKMDIMTGDENIIEKVNDAASGVIPNGITQHTSDEEVKGQDEVEEDSTKVSSVSNEADTSGVQSDQAEKEEDISNLQLAWEVLEMAKNIFKRQSKDNKEMELRVASVLLNLGEVSIESANYRQAVEDIQECLNIQKKHLQPDDRYLAETYYQLGLAYTFDNQFDEAIHNYREAIEVIENKIANLQKENPVGVRPSSGLYEQDPKVLAQEEVHELRAIVSDVMAKIEDTQDLLHNTRAAISDLMSQRSGEQISFPDTSSSSSSSQNKSATDIGHVIKRKDFPSAETKPATDISHLIKRKDPSAPVSNSSSDTKPSTDIGHLIKRKKITDETVFGSDEEKMNKQKDSENASSSTVNKEIQKQPGSTSTETKPATDISHLIKRKDPSAPVSNSSSDTRPATDIGHLIKRKRKTDETVFGSDEEIIKKRKDAENASSSTVNKEMQKQPDSPSKVAKDEVLKPFAGDMASAENQQHSEEKSTAVS